MASYLRTVAKSSSSSTSADGPANSLGKRLVKWGLIIGVPTAVCVAAYLVYRQQQEQAKKSAARRSPLPTPMASVNEDTASGLENRTKSRLTVAIELKNEGNLKYRDQKFHEAIEAYTRAIEICPMESTEELSQFYQNRAAAWESLKDYARVIEDCSKAIELNQKYVKCIQRRARAAETIGNFELALEDYSTVCFIDSYQPAYIMAADKVLTDLAKRYMETLPPSTAELSKDFVRTSLNEFEDDPILNQSFIDELKRAQPDSSLARAYQAFDEDRYTDIPSLCTNELESTTDSPYKLETLLLRGSFYLLMGSYAEALADFDTIINDPEATEKLKTLLENFTEAHDDFIEALRISPTNLRAKYQKLINDAKIGAKEHRNDRVERALSSFEEYYDTSKQDIYYALAITSCFLDNDRKDKALAYLDKFITHIPSNPTLLALKANCLMSNDPSNNTEAERLYIQALDIDPSNETVLTMFAIFKCNQNQFEEAATLYERAIHCTRGEEKLMQYAALLYAIRAQGRAIKRLNLNFPGGFPQGGALPNWMGGMP
ncbi:unnamed protein product [Rotaria magnacalcarata]|uniref:Mitochondrial import receptor subunit TOM70 n=1 Tax=Rotaria magnacalcarata TaxID=392030 RepID=A0A8S2LFT3_9BILA|nr:unnamed protein product [Rotaria magnacalcarata]